MNRDEFIGMIKETYQKWQTHDASLRAGALTFFVMMPLPSLALILIEIFAQVYGQQQAFQQFINQISVVAGPNIANIVSELLVNARSPFTSIFGSLFSVAFTAIGAIGAFSVLQKSVNNIWETKPLKRNRTSSIKKDFVPFLLITIAGLIIVAWSAFSTVFFAGVVFILKPLLGNYASLFLSLLQIIGSIGLGTLLFAIIFKQLIQIKIEWRDVVWAAVITSFVFTVLNYIFGIYLSLFHVTTLAGTAGTLMLLFLWLYITNLFILFGAQFSKIYSEKEGTLSKGDYKMKTEKTIKRLDVKLKLDWKVSSSNTESKDSD